jgi:hypothetical protein
MGKKRKTKKEKMFTSLHRQQNQIQYSLSSIPLEQKSMSASQKNIVSTSQQVLVIKDLQKTLFISAMLIILQLLFFLCLKQHIFKIPGLIY